MEPEIIPVLRELGIGLVPFCPLGRGFLTGEVKRAEEYPMSDIRHTDPRYQGGNYDANRKIVQSVYELAADKNVKPGQIALAWLLHKGPDIVPIPGTKHRDHLEDNLAAVEVELDEAQMRTPYVCMCAADSCARPYQNASWPVRFHPQHRQKSQIYSMGSNSFSN
ncbi:aldo/keto reductase [Syntrophobotulus glycolicus]|uniref:aldo/keto reductase n=1 Tax=Syntrophobotulus glycolicus TaxID=51197 RepID=UPI0002EEB237